MSDIGFTVIGRPQPGGSKRAFFNKTTHRAMVVDTNPKAKPWQVLVTDAALEATNGGLLDGPLSVELIFYFDRPQAHFGKKGLRPSAPLYPAKRPDVLKLARAVEDALTGICYRDDAQIVEEVLIKRYGLPPRCEVRLSVIHA